MNLSRDFPQLPVYSEAWGERFIETMREYINGLERAFDDDEDTGVDVDDPPTISGQVFCGCADCYEREMYLMAVALTIEGYEAGEVRLADAAPGD